MADWYVSSAAYAAITTYTISTAYTVGQIVKPTAPALKSKWTFRVTTAGTSAASEPSWPTVNNSTVTSGGAVFTNVTGQSTYAWTAAAGDLPTLLGAVGAIRFASGDRIFVSSDHAETQTASTIYGSGSGGVAGYAGSQVLSVNRAGSEPPVAADLAAGATCTVTTGTMSIDNTFPIYHYGISFVYTGASTASAVVFSQGGAKALYFDTCQLYLNTTTANCRINTNNAAVNVVFYNTTLRFGATTHGITSTYNFEILWLATPNAIAGATIPATLFVSSSAQAPIQVTARGVDLSAITGALATNTGASGSKYLFDSCRIAAGVTRYTVAGVTNTRDLVELINCFDGTGIINESYQPAGVVTTERTITLSGGATDDVGTFSHKLVSNTNIDKYVNPLVGFWLDIEQQTVGSPKTATVEIISSASLNNDEISLLLEYQGTSGSPVASFATTLPATVLTTAAAVTTSTATWNSSPATPVKQKLVVAFTPQLAGRVRGQVRLGKASATCYYNPGITIT